MKLRNLISAAVAVAAASTAGMAAATTLGGLGDEPLGADHTPVQACDTDGLDVSYTAAYSPATARYEVATIEIAALSAGCVGQTLAVTVADPSGAALATATVVADAPAITVPVPAGVAVDALARVAVVVAG